MESAQNIIQDWVNEVGKEASIKIKGDTITIYTLNPGWFIGKAGCLMDKYSERLKNAIHRINHVEFVELQETFRVGGDWDKIVEDRAEAFFLTEEGYFEDTLYDGLACQVED